MKALLFYRRHGSKSSFHGVAKIVSAIVATLAFLIPLLLQAQEKHYHFERVILEEGLYQYTVFDVLQDRNGFMWIGTSEGLYRYDGYSVKHYKHDPTDPRSLSANFARSLFEDRDGTLWIGTSGGGIIKLDPLTESFTP